MPIRALFDAQSIFDPEAIASMNEALDGTLDALGLKSKNDDLAIVAAKKIIELAKAGERDPVRLMMSTLKSLRQ